jgi:hypothetical protein
MIESSGFDEGRLLSQAVPLLKRTKKELGNPAHAGVKKEMAKPRRPSPQEYRRRAFITV